MQMAQQMVFAQVTYVTRMKFVILVLRTNRIVIAALQAMRVTVMSTQAAQHPLIQQMVLARMMMVQLVAH